MQGRTFAAILAAAMSGACAQTHGAPASAGDEPRRVDVAIVRSADLRRDIELVGTLAADEEVTVAAEVDGRVVRILADLGDAVRAGQPLVQLDPQKLQFRVDEQRAALARAKAAYGVAPGTDGDDLPSIDQTPDVRRAEAERRQADQALARADALRKRSLLPEQQFDDAQARQMTAAAALEAARQGAGNLRAEIEASAASLRLAERELLDATVRAPFDGYVQKRLTTVGQYVRVQTPVVAIVRVDPLKLVAEVAERMMPWVKIGQPVTVQVEAYPGQTMTGTLSRVSPAVNAETRAFPVEARVPNGDRRLKPGTFAHARLGSDRVDTILTVPAAAIQNRYGVNRVFVVKDAHLVSREVQLGDRVGDRVEIASGVSAGEQVALSDVDVLADGMSVQAAAADGRTD